jgi:hypothetical protein
MNGPQSCTGKFILRCTYLADQFQHALSFVNQSLWMFPVIDCDPRARSRRSSGRRAALEVVGGLFPAWSSLHGRRKAGAGKAIGGPLKVESRRRPIRAGVASVSHGVIFYIRSVAETTLFCSILLSGFFMASRSEREKINMAVL